MLKNQYLILNNKFIAENCTAYNIGSGSIYRVYFDDNNNIEELKKIVQSQDLVYDLAFMDKQTFEETEIGKYWIKRIIHEGNKIIISLIKSR